MEDLLNYLAQNIVDNPEDVSISSDQPVPGYLNLHLKVNPQDMGKIIGKDGRIIHAVRDLLKIYGLKNGFKVNLQLLEEVH